MIITAADSKTPVITSPDFTVAVTEVYTAIARDADEGENAPGLILLDDFTAP